MKQKSLKKFSNFQNSRMEVFLLHGEESAQDHLATVIRDKFGLVVSAPEYLEEILLGENTERDKIRRPAPAPADEFDLSLIPISEPTSLLSTSYSVFCLKK